MFNKCGEHQMKHSIIDLLIRPCAFFQNAMTDKESLKFPALIILALGIAGAMYGYLVGGLTGQLLGGILPGMGTMMELSQITMIISMVFLLWSANIWIFGVQHARKLSPSDAALCAGIPVVLYILYMVYSMAVM
jgi:hypothetical protein